MLFFPVVQNSPVIIKKFSRKKLCNSKHDSFEELQNESNIGILYFFKKIDFYSLISNLWLLFYSDGE